jgi:predicted ArsR family transcriptional regulator
MLQHAREIAPSVSWEILVRVKRSGGMSVNELAAELKMSYMGVKQHCDDLRKQGYVDTWRRPKGTGRPEKIYRPAPKLDLVLTNWGSELCLGLLAHAAQAYGESAPDRLLYSYLQQKAERWASKMKGKTLRERLVELVKMRNADGWMSELVTDEQGTRLLDHHSPLAEVARLYPNVWEMESRALTKVLGIPIERTVNGTRSEMRLITGDEVPAPAVVPVSTLVEEVAPVLETEPVPEPEPEPDIQHAPEPQPEPVPIAEAEVEFVEQAAPVLEPTPAPVVEEIPSWPEPLMPPVFADVPDVKFEPEDVVAIVEEEPTLAAEVEEPDSPSRTPASVEVMPTAPAPKSKQTTASAKKGQAVQADLFDF